MAKRDGLSEMSLMMSSAELANLQMAVASAWLQSDSMDERVTANVWAKSRYRSDKVPAYHEYELGATAQLGGGEDFWTAGMKAFVSELNESEVTVAKDQPNYHIALRRKIGARMLLEETDETDTWVQ